MRTVASERRQGGSLNTREAMSLGNLKRCVERVEERPTVLHPAEGRNLRRQSTQCQRGEG